MVNGEWSMKEGGVDNNVGRLFQHASCLSWLDKLFSLVRSLS